MIQPFKSLVF